MLAPVSIMKSLEEVMSLTKIAQSRIFQSSFFVGSGSKAVYTKVPYPQTIDGNNMVCCKK